MSIVSVSIVIDVKTNGSLGISFIALRHLTFLALNCMLSVN